MLTTRIHSFLTCRALEGQSPNFRFQTVTLAAKRPYDSDWPSCTDELWASRLCNDRAQQQIFNRFHLANLEHRIQSCDSQDRTDWLGRVYKLEINPRSLQCYERSHTSSINDRYPGEVDYEVAAIAADRRAQQGRLFASHESAPAAQDDGFTKFMSGYGKHD